MLKNKTDFRILVIDDNFSIHQDFIKILTSRASAELEELDAEIFGEKNATNYLPQFEIDTASQGEEGVGCIEKALKEGRPYALAFVDIRMPPGWDGIETIKHIWQLDKEIQLVICTAYSDYSWEETVEHLGQTDNLLVLKKPFDNVAVRQLACALTKKWQLMQDARRYTALLEQKVVDRTASLQNSLSLVKATLESSDDGILLVGNDGQVVDYNLRFASICNISETILESKQEEEIIKALASQQKDGIGFIAKVKELYSQPNAISLDLLQFKDGKIIERYSQPQKLDGVTVGRVWSYRDITKRAKLEEKLQYQATHDALTGLCNRVLLHDRIRQLIEISKVDQSYFAVLFIDLDRFKLVNDSFSHAVGDELLQAVANRLQRVMRKNDTLARLGGDEFVMLITNVATEEDIVSIVYKILRELTQPFTIVERELTVTACIGISLFPKDGNGVDILMRNADAAMYSAKENGSNQFEFYSIKMNNQSLKKLDQEAQLRRAIINKEFFLCYQPQIDLRSKKLTGVEALIRWQHPEKGVIPPMDFIPLAEKTGLIVAIGEWVMRTACIQNKAWQDEGFPPVRVAVNVTAQQFKQKNLVELVSNILVETGLKPEFLEIELTENVIISTGEIAEVIKKLKALGVQLALDDFGTGYSSLSYLKRIPLDRLKIDQGFIQNIMKNKDDEVIIRAIIAMAGSLNLEVIAEGVETKNQLNFLIAEECGQMQGFYYSKPLSINEVEILLKQTATVQQMNKDINRK